jgi:outer membrane immunogenic protein
MSRNFWLCTALLFAPTAGNAADAVVAEPAAVYAVTQYDWSGAYVGGFGGYGWGDGVYANIANAVRLEGDVEGGLLGARIGYRHQWGSIVIGAAASGAFANIDGSGSFGGNSTDFHTRWLANADVQLGFALDRALIYGFGGGAAAGIEHDYDGGVDVSYDEETHTGYSYGAGLEYAFTDRISGWFEARRYELDDERFGQVADVIPHTVDVDFTTVTVGVNFNF